MSSLNAGIMLAYLAGTAVFVCAVMLVYWATQRVPPGYGLWASSCALIALGCVVLAIWPGFPARALHLVVCGLVAVAAVLRLQGMLRFLGRRRFLRWPLLLPVAAIALAAVFTFAWDSASARAIVVAAAVALVFWLMALVLFVEARNSHPTYLRSLAVLFALYGALWLGSGIHWLIKGTGFPTGDIDTHGVSFLVAITAFEFLWLIGCLIFSTKWSTEALETAHSLVDSERRQLADIIAFLPDATFALDKDCTVIAWNRVMEEKTGLQASQVIGLPRDKGPLGALMQGDTTLSETLLDPMKTIPARCRNVRREVDSISAEEEFHHPDFPEKSGHFWHLATLLRDADGQVTGTIESIRDLNWRVEAERSVRESEERYRSLFEHSLDGILVIAPGGAVVDANPSACRMLGMTQEEICAADPGSLTRRPGQEEDGMDGDSILGPSLRELTFIRGDGSVFPAECMSVVWNDSSGHLHAFGQFRDISERVEAQRILQESQARLRDTQAGPRMGNWEMDLVGRSIWLSPEALNIFGLDSRSPYFPLSPLDLTNLAEDPVGLRASLTRVMTQGGSYDVEYFIHRVDDGVLRKVHSVGAAICNDDGVPTKVVGATQDVTDSATDSGLPDLAFYAMNHSEDQVFWVDWEGRITNVSESACTQLGYTRDELLSMTIYDVNPSLSPGAASALDEVKSGGSRRHETVHRTKDGRDIPYEVTVNYAQHGDRDYKFVVAHDISERKRLEETLLRTQLSLERGGEIVLWADRDGRLEFATDVACAKLGYTRDELLAMTLFELVPALSRDWKGFWAELQDCGVLSRGVVCRGKGGVGMPMDAVFNWVEHDGRNFALVAVRELPEEMGTADKNAGVDVAGLQNQKLEAVGQLAGGIAHDFNNLLTAIIGYGNLILADEDARGLKSLRRDAEEIRSAAERAAALTSQILAFARRQPLRPSKVCLGDFVAGNEERLRALITDDIQLIVTCASETGVVEADTEQFERVLMNLAKNACEAMPAGGRMLVQVENVELSEEACMAYPELRAGSYVVLSVSDTGVGMDAHTRMRIFEPFFTTKPPGEGAGLGLSVVYGVVRQSGGQVIAYSEVGKGTTLKIYLPRVAEPADVEQAKTAPAAPSGRGGETVLVVEDEPPLRRLVARVLGEGGYHVFVAGSGPEALELLQDMEEPPDLLITDVVLPGGLQGNELAAAFVAKMPNLPVLYMSGHPRDAIVHAGRLDDGVAFLGKPFTPQGLSSKVREVLDSHPETF